MKNQHYIDKAKGLIMSRQGSLLQHMLGKLGRSILLLITAIPTIAVVFIVFFIIKESVPFFYNLAHVKEFFTSTTWTPSKPADPSFGALSIFYGTLMVTVGSSLIAVPLGIMVSVCLTEIVSYKLAQIFKPFVELLAAIPSVAYGFFALVVFAPVLQNYGGAGISAMVLIAGIFLSFIAALVISEFFGRLICKKTSKQNTYLAALIFVVFMALFIFIAVKVSDIKINSGANALNVSIILAIMALPTIVSISQDALSAVGRDLREGSLALGATKFETIFKVVLPSAKSGIAVAVILGLMRVIGETMVVWMASGNSLKIPEPFYNFLEPVRTLTATIAGEMGEADQSTGSARYHVLFVMSLCLLLTGMLMNTLSQWVGVGMKRGK